MSRIRDQNHGAPPRLRSASEKRERASCSPEIFQFVGRFEISDRAAGVVSFDKQVKFLSLVPN